MTHRDTAAAPRRVPLALAAALALSALPALGGLAPAAAQDIRIGPGGVRVDPGFGGRGADLGRGEAVRIARRQGLVDLDGVDRRGPRLIVRGQDRRGDDIVVVVDARSGDVVDVRHP